MASAAEITGCSSILRLPSDWGGFNFVLRNGEARYSIEVKPVSKGTAKITVNGKKLTKAENGIPLEPSGEHKVIIEVLAVITLVFRRC